MDEPRVDDSGLGAAARMGLEMYHHAGRNSGRTYRMIMALEPNSIVLCYEKGQWLEHTIKDLRGYKFSAKVTPCTKMDEVYHNLDWARRTGCPVAIDHYLLAQLYLEHIQAFTHYLADLGIPEHNHGLIENKPPPVQLFRMDGSMRLRD